MFEDAGVFDVLSAARQSNEGPAMRISSSKHRERSYRSPLPFTLYVASSVVSFFKMSTGLGTIVRLTCGLQDLIIWSRITLTQEQSCSIQPLEVHPTALGLLMENSLRAGKQVTGDGEQHACQEEIRRTLRMRVSDDESCNNRCEESTSQGLSRGPKS